MPLPFYERETPKCPACQRRKHLDHYWKWKDGDFNIFAKCSTCEPSARPENPSPDALRRERAHLEEKARRFAPRPPKPVAVATCPGCSRELKLQEFRKWWGSKRMARTLCITCEPERRLEDMSASEREMLVRAGRATPARVAAINEAQTREQSQRRSTGAKRRHSMARTQAWAPMLRVLRDERQWCVKNRITPASPQWDAFFEAYAYVLSDMLRQATAKKRASTSTSVVPEPKTFLYPETLVRLRQLYSKCAPVRGRRFYRDPAFLAWFE